MQGVVPKMSESPGRVTRSGGDLGADNEAVFLDELGLSTDELRDLRQLNVI
jgi:crotonobetainyl-CoA:carnitine CoA-transferase CaiB-like acyl-CoA transferase